MSLLKAGRSLAIVTAENPRSLPQNPVQVLTSSHRVGKRTIMSSSSELQKQLSMAFLFLGPLKITSTAILQIYFPHREV